MNDYAEITSLSNYIDLTGDLSDSLTNESGSTPHLWYRGHACTEEAKSDWKLIPSLQRVLKTHDKDAYFEEERSLNNDFLCRASLFLEKSPDMNDFPSWLTLMQHYGFPTRLLDWSRSPLYALYFATASHKHYDFDGCIWVLQPGLLNQYAALQPKTYLYHMAHKQVCEVAYSAFKGYEKTDENIRLYQKYEDKIIASYATYKDQRVSSQQAAFTVHNSLKTLEEIHAEIQLHEQGHLLTRLLIPHKYKKHIFNDLFHSGITHSNVFPDIEHLAMDIKRLYGIDQNNRS